MSDTLITGISGIRGLVGLDITPEVVARYAAAFGTIASESGNKHVVLARDTRTSGEMLGAAARAGLQSVGCDVIDCGVVPTPTAALAVEHHGAGGGLFVTASHNPAEWNALKFVGSDGVFLEEERGRRLLHLADGSQFSRASWDAVGSAIVDEDAVQRHLTCILELPEIDVARVRKRGYKVALDCVRGAGAAIMLDLLERLGCTAVGMDLEPDGQFPRAPEPLPENLVALGELVCRSRADLGIAVDPDVDRLALTDHHGTPIGEDYTLALAVDAVLAREQGPVVVNLSTSLVVDDVARDYGVKVQRVPVGEGYVARAMRSAGAVVGGEGNGGVILSRLHLGRDAPLAAALVLELLARESVGLSELVAKRPRYSIVKSKAPRGADMDEVYTVLGQRFPDAAPDRRDGLRLEWNDRWLHVRPSGTEPIVRLIAEAPSREDAEALVAVGREVVEG